MFIVWTITSKRATKRNFAIAGLILVVLALVLCVAGHRLLRAPLLSFFQWIRQSINPAQAAQALQSVTPGPLIPAYLPGAAAAPACGHGCCCRAQGAFPFR